MTTYNTPQIRKAKSIVGDTLVFRDATTSDASFILSLRTDSGKAKHLSVTGPNEDRQISWLLDYASKTDQAYFIIENQVGEPMGTVRLYDPRGDSFCWGSWILKDGAPQRAAIESALMVYVYATDHLGFCQSHFEVRKGNESVWRFHERFGAERTGETEQDYQYQIVWEKIVSARQRYSKYLSKPLEVEVWHE